MSDFYETCWLALKLEAIPGYKVHLEMAGGEWHVSHRMIPPPAGWRPGKKPRKLASISTLERNLKPITWSDHV